MSNEGLLNSISEMPADWEAQSSMVLVHLVREGSGASDLSRSMLVEALAAFREELKAYELGADAAAEILERFRVSRIPSVLVLHRGQLLGCISGLYPAEHLVEEFDRFYRQLESETLNTSNNIK